MALGLIQQEVVDACIKAFYRLAEIDEENRIDAINDIRSALHEYSPLKREPVDCVIWVRGDQLRANDYNPNNVANS